MNKVQNFSSHVFFAFRECVRRLKLFLFPPLLFHLIFFFVQGIRPSPSPRWKSSSNLMTFSQILGECWHGNPSARLSGLRVKKTLTALLQNEVEGGSSNNSPPSSSGEGGMPTKVVWTQKDKVHIVFALVKVLKIEKLIYSQPIVPKRMKILFLLSSQTAYTRRQ